MTDTHIQILALILLAILGVQIFQLRSMIRIRRRLRILLEKRA